MSILNGLHPGELFIVSASSSGHSIVDPGHTHTINNSFLQVIKIAENKYQIPSIYLSYVKSKLDEYGIEGKFVTINETTEQILLCDETYDAMFNFYMPLYLTIVNGRVENGTYI